MAESPSQEASITVAYGFFIPIGGTAAPDIAGHPVDFRNRNHFHRFLTHSAGGRLQVQLLRHRDHEHEVIPPGAFGHQRLEHLFHRLAHFFRHRHPVDPSVGMVVFVGGIRHSHPVQNPHGVGFQLFRHRCLPLCRRITDTV